jgi:hypothetical protein
MSNEPLIETGIRAAHTRVTRLINEVEDDGLRHRAECLLDFYDREIVAAVLDGQGDSEETLLEMKRFQTMANRLYRDAYRAGMMVKAHE